MKIKFKVWEALVYGFSMCISGFFLCLIVM